jgi:hypothetical protein
MDLSRHAGALDLQLAKLKLEPTTAAALLRSGPVLRPVQKERVAAFAHLMRANARVLNGIPIIISATGRLLDGPHRLLASVEAHSSFPTILASNVADDMIHLIDQHHRRSFAQVLEARGLANPRDVEQLLLTLLHYHDGSLGKRSSAQPWARMERVLHRNPQIAAIAAAPADPAAAALPDAIRLPLLFMGSRSNRPALARLLAAFADPGLHPDDAAGAMLRHAIAQHRQDRSANARATRHLAFALQALNAEQSNATPRRLVWSPGRPFPRLDFYPPLPGADWQAPGEEAAQPCPHDDADLARCMMSVERVTPTRAAQFLQANRRHRPVILAYVEALVSDMRAGSWTLNPQPICFGADGRLLNGQHRLLAIIQSGATIELPIIRGLPDAAFDTYDLQARQGSILADLLPGFGDGALLASMANLLWRHECTPMRSRPLKASAAELCDVLAAHPRLVDMRSFARRMMAHGRPSVLGYAAYVIIREDPLLGAAFLQRLDGSVAEGLAQPVARLRRKLLAMRRAGAPRETVLAAVLACWRGVRQRGTI